jgi:hypothetical protein
MVRATSFATASRSSPRVAKGTIIAPANIIAGLRAISAAAGNGFFALASFIDEPNPCLA